MPIPTDTFWNIKRLNIVFALSAIALFAVTAWTILQDYGGYWRVVQKDARVWDAAITSDKIARDLTPADEKHLQDLQKQIADKQNELDNHDKNYSSLVLQRKQLESDKATLDFRVNNRKSNVQVLAANLQDALAADEQDKAKKISAELEPLQNELNEWTETLAEKNDQLREVRQKLDDETAQLDALKKQQTALDGDAEALTKRLGALAPRSLVAKLSETVRNMPLMGFINPSNKVQQIVLPDVHTALGTFMNVTTIDRCMTCHVNINNKDFTEDKVLAYLEEEAGAARKISLPAEPGSRSTLPQGIEAKPGAVAMPEFWHHWTQILQPDNIAKQTGRFNTIKNQIGAEKPIKVTYSGQPVTDFAYDAKLRGEASAKQDAILLAVIRALEQVPAPYEASRGTAEPVDLKFTDGPVTVNITGKSTDTAIINSRNAALKYVELIRDQLMAAIPADQAKLLLSRYRYNLVDVVNPARRNQGLPTLDPSEALLAHPRLDLYVDVDSPHSFEAVGCTSCHDGSGQETDFVLAAHTARDIFVDAKSGAPLPDAALGAAAEHPQVNDLSSMLAAAENTKGLYFQPTTQPSEQAGSADESERPINYVDPATGKSGRAIKQMAYWENTFQPNAPRSFELVYHEWDWPMRTPQYIQANCARCHTDVYDIKDTAPTLYEGRQLFTQLGCVNCHQMDSIPSYENRKVGTDLRHVTAKLSSAFINTWIWAPKAFRPTTKMPHFFMLENNSSDEELRRTRQEARAITEYLVRTAEPLPPKYVYPQGGHGSVEAGRAIFNSMGCLACHQNLNERGEEWITTDMVKGSGMTADAAKAAYGAMTYNERQLYVQQHLAEPYGHEVKPTYPDGSPKPEFVQVGPELSGIGTKLTAGRTEEQARQWLFNWLKEPRHYSEYTIMPRLRVTDQQALDLAEYLLNQKRTTNDPNDKWEAGLTPVDTNKLIELTALQLKSRYSWQTAQVKADDDVELTTDAQVALTTPVKSADDAKAEVATMTKDEKRLVFLGQKLIGNYGCMSCHAINGMETVSSPCANLSDWGQKGVDKLDFGYLASHKVAEFESEGVLEKPVHLVNGLSAAAANLVHEDVQLSDRTPPDAQISHVDDVTWPEVDHSRVSWITQKLKNTRIFDRAKVLLEPEPGETGSPYDKLKMPTFYLNNDQVHAIVTFVISNRDRLISQSLTEKATNAEAKKIAHGRELTERYNCVACHQIEKNSPQIHQYYKTEDIPTAAPPSLRGEGNKIQYNWLFNFFKNVEPMRPLLFEGIHMPSFPATDEEFSSIITYFNSISNKESKDLSKQIDPVMKYVNFQRKATTQPVADPAQPQPGDDWWQKPEFAASAQYLKDWGLTFGHIKPVEIGIGAPASPEDLRKTYAKLLFKARFTRELYDAPFPFVDTPRPDISPERFALGEKFFYEMQCLKCHVLGDPSVPGANTKPTAPNLSLASRRLQRTWIRHWVQEPNIIQVGTAMPPFFTGLPNDVPVNLHGQPWPDAQETKRPKDQIEADYGKTVDEETGLLLDFIYAAGVRGFTGVQPPDSTTQPAASP